MSLHLARQERRKQPFEMLAAGIQLKMTHLNQIWLVLAPAVYNSKAHYGGTGVNS